MTLRITRRRGSRPRATLTLEGSITAEWAALLERECSDLLKSRPAITLDLTAVTFIDLAGVRALGRLSHGGIEIRCRPGPVASVLEGEGIPVTQIGTDAPVR